MSKTHIIIGTTSIPERLEDLEITNSFNVRITLNNLKKEDVMNVLNNYEGNNSDKEKITSLVGEVPIKQLLLMLEMSKQLSGGSLTYEAFITAYEYFSNRY